ncbi:MAG: serine/threonine protein kinase [Gammaproteobacteria bacterium]|nr:serine/threonine protein kinase [Gammaproteobacteria bacterium]
MTESTFIGRYKILEELGRGAMSVVYRAEDPDIGRQLAIKLLKHDLIEQDEYRELFVSEAKSAGRLSHPSIVTIYDTGIWNGRPFIAMELLEGTTLEEYLYLNDALSLDDLIRMAKKLSQALEYAHRQGVIHRDLKPENIFVVEQGKNFKITDFGIAKIESDYLQGQLGQDDEAAERDDRIMGTPAYMSPEQISGHGIDAKTDFYSLGVILYQASKGELPFKAINHAAMLQAVLQQNPEPLNMNSESGAIWQSIVFRLLQKNPDLRYESAQILIDELEKLEKEHQENIKGLAEFKFVSMSARWAMGLSAFVFLVMIVGMIWVNKRQTDLMNQLMFDYGFSISQIIASETAEPLLLEESLSLQSITETIAENQQILHLSIRDKNQLIASSSQKTDVGQPFVESEVWQPISDSAKGAIYYDESSFAEAAYYFDSPIIYQQKEVGRVNVAISRTNLQQATNSSLLTMVIWMLLILLVVFSGVYWLTKKFAKRVNISRQKIHDIRLYGEAEPISISMHDELGRMEQEINRLSHKIAGLTRTQKITLVDVNAELAAELENAQEVDKTIVISPNK